ncbi:hypothetical protein ACP70R_007409 [Stipagrostis hirtigluma subsp. patula]
MAGEEQCTAKSTEAVSLAGEGDMTKASSTRWLAPGEVVRGGQLLSPVECPGKREAAGCAEGEKPPGPKHLMSEREIRWILNRKPMDPPSRYQALKQSNPDLTPPPGEAMDEEKERLYFLANAFDCMEERFPKLQEWVRQELDTKGFVEMDDDWVQLQRRAEVQAALEEGWKKIEALLLSESEDEDDNDESDYDDEEDEGEE